MNREKLAAALLADRERALSTHNIVACFVCGHTYITAAAAAN